MNKCQQKPLYGLRHKGLTDFCILSIDFTPLPDGPIVKPFEN